MTKQLAERVTRLALIALTLSMLAVPVWAQEEEAVEEDTGFGTWIAELGFWIAQPSGLNDYVTAVSDPTDPFNTRLLSPSHGTNEEDYAKVGIDLARNKGRILITWYGHREESEFSARRPGDFIFSTLLVDPTYAGFSLDGRADAVDAFTQTRMRDGRLEYSRVAFTGARVEGRWFAAYRRVDFFHRTDATYSALAPNLPPFFPGAPLLAPLADSGETRSKFRGRGLELGMEFRAPLFQDKVALEASASMTALRGKADTTFRSFTSFYTDSTGQLLLPPYSELADPMIAAGARQEVFETGLRSESLSQSGSVIDTSIAIRWNINKRMNAVVGFRNAYFQNVGIDLRPAGATINGSLANVRQVERSANYEGFFGGLRFLF